MRGIKRPDVPEKLGKQLGGDVIGRQDYLFINEVTTIPVEEIDEVVKASVELKESDAGDSAVQALDYLVDRGGFVPYLRTNSVTLMGTAFKLLENGIDANVANILPRLKLKEEAVRMAPRK